MGLRHKGPARFLNSGDCRARGTQAGQVVVRQVRCEGIPDREKRARPSEHERA